MANEASYSGEQVALAARELRQAAGTDQERFSTRQVLSMLSDEIRLLRERGFNDAQIADLFTGFDIPVSADEIGQSSAAPRFTD